MDCQLAPSKVVVCDHCFVAGSSAEPGPFAVHVEAASADQAYGMIGQLRNMCMGMRVPSCHLYMWTMPPVFGYSRAKGSLPFTNQVVEFSMVTDVVSFLMEQPTEKALCLCMAFLITWFDNRAYQIVIQGTFCTFCAEASCPEGTSEVF